MRITLHGHRMSQPSRAVELLLLINDIGHTFNTVDFVNGETRTKQYIETVNANGKIPVLQDGDFKLLESHAMMRYLSRKFELKQWYGSDLKEKAVIDQWLDWHHLNTRTYSSDMLHAIAILNFVPMMLKIEVKTLQIEELNRKLRMSLSVLDKQLENKKFIAGNTATIVDLSIGCELYQLKCYEYNFSEFKNIDNWLNNLEKLPKWTEAHEVVIGAAKQFLSNEKNTSVMATVSSFVQSKV
jgi:glutathione S-transferase